MESRGGVALGPMLEERFGIPTFINNDGDLFVYGEAIAGFLPYVNGLLEKAGSPKRYKNLFGTIDREVDRNGVWRSDFTLIKAGSIVKADGGYLVLNALDALSEPGVWNTLKRILRNRQIEIQPPES